MIAIMAALFGISWPIPASDERAPIELCDDGSDNDGDGQADEATCRFDTTSSPVSGSGFAPEAWSGNPDCTDLGYRFGFKIETIDPGDPQLYSLISSDGVLLNGAPEDPDNTILVDPFSAWQFDWVASLALDVVFVKSVGGNAYNYRPWIITDDTELGTLGIETIDTITFCYTYHLGVEATAESRLVGNEYIITGSVTVTNPTPFPATFEAGITLLDPINDISVPVDCPSNSVDAENLAGIECTFSADLADGVDGDETASKATITVTPPNAPVLGNEATIPITYIILSEGFEQN